MNLIVNFTSTGMIPTKEMTPHVPISINEIVEDVHAAGEVGITMVHLHARDKDTGEPTYKAEVYRDIIEGIRRFSKDLVVCVSLSGRTFREFKKRAEALQLDGDSKPDMGSLTLSSVNFNHIASMSSPDMIQSLARELIRRGVLAELEAFDAGMINYAKYLEKKKLLKPPHYFNLLLGNIACAQADLLHVGVMIRDLPTYSYWSLAGIGEAQLMMNSIAIAAGGGLTGEVTGEVRRLLTVLVGEMKRTDIQEALALRHEDYFREAYLIPALTAGIIEMTIPGKPTSSKQKYRLTQKGRNLIAKLAKEAGTDGK